MSFDPQNPRGAPRPPQPPTPPPTPSQSPRPATSYIPPQPVNRGPSRLLLATGIVIVFAILGFAVFFLLNFVNIPHQPATPPPSGASTTAPTLAGSPNGSSVPSTVPPTTAGSPPLATPLGSPSSGYTAFLAHVPDALRASCLAGESSDQTIPFSARCTSSDGIIVTYDQFTDAPSMDAAFQSAFADQQIDASTGSCEDHNTWPAEGPYEVENSPVGRRLCADWQGEPTIYWTDERLNIYASATAADPVRLIQFWTTEAGPIQ